MNRAIAIVAVMAVGVTSGWAGTGISTVTKLLEQRYGVRHHGVPVLWMAKPFMIGSGVGGLKIAQFQNFNIPATDMDTMLRQVETALGPEWRPFVQTWSKRDREWSVIYAATTGKKLRMLIVSSEQDDGITLVQMDVSGKIRDGWLVEPVRSSKQQTRRDEMHVR